MTENNFVRDTGKLWNQAPPLIKEALTIGTAKMRIRQYQSSKATRPN